MPNPVDPEEIPKALADRPRDRRGYPIPHSAWCDPVSGEYDFRVLDQMVRLQDLQERRCAVSGRALPPGEYWFIGGPPNFSQRVFVDGPMLQAVAEYSLRTCPHLALLAATYRSAGISDKQRLQGPSREKPALLMLGLAADYELVDVEGYPYVRAGPWKAVTWWREGRRLSKPEALALLADVAPELDMSPDSQRKR